MKTRVAPYPVSTICDYCGAPVIFTSNAAIYGREFGSGKCYKCTRCDSYVSVHAGTDIPMGRLANKELRDLKKKCHALFDPVWKNIRISRDTAYQRLAVLIGIPSGECHFGWFDKDLLHRSLDVLQDPSWYRQAICPDREKNDA